MKKNERGITLIALVVTIVVLLILAAVSISMLTGENGIINQANNSKDATEQARVEELVDLAVNSLIGKNMGSTNGITPEMVAEEVNKMENRDDVYTEGSTFPTKIIFPEEGRKVDIDLNGKDENNDIYNTDIDEADIAQSDLFEYEIIDDAEIGATTLNELPTKKARILRIKTEYCNGLDDPELDTNYEIIYKGTQISDTLIIPYQVDGQYVEGGQAGEMYKITEVNLSAKGGSGYGAGLPKVETIIYPNTVEKILGDISMESNMAYDNNITIKTVILSNNLKVIDTYAFSGCGNLKNITIPDGVTSIGDGVFKNCSNLTNITIPESVTSIGYGAFYNCGSLTSITIPEGVTSIGNSAFYNCDNLTSITIPNSVTSIGAEAFRYCDSLTSIIIPEGVTSIGARAFYVCDNLTSITISTSVTNIGENTFKSCDNLKEIRILRNENSSTISGEPWGANRETEIIYINKQYLDFAENYLANKNQQQLEELVLKSVGFTGTIEEFKQEINLEQEAVDKNMEYTEYLRYILTDEESWVYVEYMVSKQGGEGKTVQELEQLFVEQIGYPGTFEQLLAEENMTRGDFENMIKRQGFRSEEDYLKMYIYCPPTPG